MSDVRQLANALRAFSGVKSVTVEDETVMFFVDDENIAGVLRNLQDKIDVSSAPGQVALRVTFDENNTVGFVVEANRPAHIDGLTRALTGEPKLKFRLASGCPRCGDMGMAYNKKRREYICKVCGSTIDEDLVEK
jgi:ribosomal protein S27AE